MERIADLCSDLEAVREDVLDFLGGLSDTEWETPVQSEGERWTVRDIVSHLADTEMSQAALVRAVVAGLDTIPDDFDIDRWNRGRVRRMADRTPAELITGLAAGRTTLLDLLAELTEDDLARTGRHPAVGEAVTVDRFLELMAWHEGAHLTEMRSGLESSG